MKIYLSFNTAGSSTNSLNGDLKNFDKLIQEKLDKAEFKSSFEELWLSLSYPPVCVGRDWVSQAEVYLKRHESFPYFRLSRKLKKIDVILKAPEFSEHFDEVKDKKFAHQFEIEKKYKDISNDSLARILINKYLEAAELINSKLKNEDVFDFVTFKKVLLDINEEIDKKYIKSANIDQTQKVKESSINREKDSREKRKNNIRPKNKYIKDFRIYYHGLPDGALYPYDYQYMTIFLYFLVFERLMLPNYTHIYINISKTLDDALEETFAAENWYENGIAALDYENYLKQSETEKEKIAFNTIANGLKDIATIDGLDMAIIHKVINTISLNGLNSELFYRKVENKNYLLKVIVLAKSHEEENPVFFDLTDKTSNITKRINIGKATSYQVWWWLYKITMTNKKIKIIANKSDMAQIWLKNIPREMEFDIAELMK